MGDDKSRKETEQSTTLDARRKGGESALSYIKSKTHVKDAMLEKDLVSAYTNAQMKLLQVIFKEWFEDPASDDCLRVKLKLEVTPDEKALAGLSALFSRSRLVRKRGHHRLRQYGTTWRSGCRAS